MSRNESGSSADAGRIAVIGAGVSGLIAARMLTNAGADVTVFESADRVGGRVSAVTTGLGSRIDLGGQWVGADHHRLIALLDELGLTRLPVTRDVSRAIRSGRSRSLLRMENVPAFLTLGLFELFTRFGLPRRMSERTLDAAISKVPTASRRLLEVVAGVSWTSDLDRHTLGAAVRLSAAQGGLSHSMRARGGAQDSLILEGAGTIAELLAAELGDRVRLEQRVEGILRRPSGVTVETPEGEYEFDRVIVAVAPPVAREIQHEPPLPSAHRRMEEGTYMGSVYKAFAIYPLPFWHQRKAQDSLLLDRPGGAVFDTSPPTGQGHLCFLIPGPEGRALADLDPTERQRLLLAPLVRTHGPGVLKPAEWHEKFWHLDPHVKGGYSTLPLPGTAMRLPLRRTPAGPVHWASTEYARDHPGYIDGAIEAGEAAAREVLRALRDA